MVSIDNKIDFANNPEPRCPCVLLLDTSMSMKGAPIDALNAGVQRFRDELIKDKLAARRVEVAVVSFNTHIDVLQPFVTANRFSAPVLSVQGFTSMGTAIERGLDLIQDRKNLYRMSGIAYYRPWMVMVTDGQPHGEGDHAIRSAAARIRKYEDEKRISFFAVGVQDASMDNLARISVRPPIMLQNLNFEDMFVWLSASMHLVSRAAVSELPAVPVPNIFGAL